ncbi:UPF0653 protein C607.02c [Taphrina deformans PYCC 5710]|uniref:UPF0653 protein C607.02c n=1 Tax=Taphrina deformans (strain PYCC 5710 / ATCC 11124 / CBS 356.35 / IMI 108563 / JCM 9778 / NBRC 8474) TaxID=1097556 RepID=R4X890_TAPDE|nr:UPF0653 protein C607.02c [Taphrina deformans PYCC 5710]|eukprot:CCG81482.1 UPF0653 protein C607.02c [Taphrina deformans PYCC 5710]
MGQKRKRGQLAAEAVAAQANDEPLSKSALAKSKRKKRTRAEELGGNTPKGFLSLIHYKERTEQTKKDSAQADQWKRDAALAQEIEKLVPRTGENISDFNRRVDSALPIKYTKTRDVKGSEIEDFAEKRRKKQAARQNQQNEEHLNMLRKKHEQKFETTDKDWDDYEFATHTKSGRGRQKSPDPWAVLLRPERQYKFNDTVEAPPVLSNKGKFVKKALQHKS